MQLLTTLLSIVIMIELWHIAYYCYFKEKYFDYPFKLVSWATSYKNMYKGFMEFSEHYANNEELQKLLPDLCTPTLAMIDAFQSNTPSETSSKILQSVPIKHLMFFLLQQAVEVLYWGISFAFMFVFPNGTGLWLFLLSTLLSYMQKYFNKNNNKLLHTADSCLCITLYVICLVVF